MSGNVPYVFKGGEAAKAQEVNANFQEVVNMIGTLNTNLNDLEAEQNEIIINKANITGDGNQTFEVAPATKPTHAVQYNQFLQFQEIFKMNISGMYIRKINDATFVVTPGGCYDSTMNYSIVLKTNKSVTTSNLESNTEYKIAVIATTDNPYNVSVQYYTGNISLMDTQVYRDIAIFTTTSTGSLPDNFERLS